MLLGLPHQMLASPETDLQPKLLNTVRKLSEGILCRVVGESP
jgi:hypothetical protein